MSAAVRGVATPAFKFAPPTPFHAELKRRVDEYFQRVHASPRGGVRLYVKTAVVLGWAAASYALLVFAASSWWQLALLCGSLGFAIAAIGFNVQHDGSHGAYSERRWVNRVMALALDAIGGSSYVWKFKHNVFHHSYTNLVGADDDINLGALGRLSPAQKRHWFHRFQHIYIWPLYGTVGVKWQLFDDFVRLLRGRIGTLRFPRPRGWDLVSVCAGKAFFFALAFGVPAMLHPAWKVALMYGATMVTTGFVLAVIFQLAHSVREADHPVTETAGATAARLAHDWAAHQVQTTVDFARRNPVLTWFVGGLNYQIEHHLFPRVAHLHYPALSRIVEDVSARFGVQYAAHRSFFGAVRSHFRFLREMGRPSMA